jgi:hypothetical protein
MTVIDTTTARLRAESLMTSTCTVRAKGTGEPVMDPDTGEVVQVPGATHYTGKCRVRPGGTQSTSTAEAGAMVLFTFDYVISVPFAEADMSEGDEVTVISSPDPALNGRTVEIQRIDRGEHLSARRLYCKEVV